MKYIAGSDVPSVKTDQIYDVPRAKCEVFFYLMVCNLSIVAVIILAILMAVDVIDEFPWWMFGLVGSGIGPTHYLLSNKTTKIVLHTNQEMTHLNILGKPCKEQNHVALANYQRIALNGNEVLYTKTTEYLEQCRRCAGCLQCCVRQTESYRVTDPDRFAADFGMTKTFISEAV